MPFCVAFGLAACFGPVPGVEAMPPIIVDSSSDIEDSFSEELYAPWVWRALLLLIPRSRLHNVKPRVRVLTDFDRSGPESREQLVARWTSHSSCPAIGGIPARAFKLWRGVESCMPHRRG